RPPMDASVVLCVDGKKQSLSAFAIPEMSLSSARTEMKKHSFSVTVSASDMLARLAAPYDAWVADSKKDDQLCAEPQDELAEAGYPALQQVLAMPNLLELVVGHYLFGELVRPLIWNGHGPIEYWFDQVTSCRSTGIVVEVAGVCFSRR
ncbi:hypothetical protein, partial [Niveibacterium umoris]|uniref:hypothetical protein n=2 Tax=Niveibacterium umoris TaxID=1193620 RepID=UPI001A8E88EC